MGFFTRSNDDDSNLDALELPNSSDLDRDFINISEDTSGGNLDEFNLNQSGDSDPVLKPFSSTEEHTAPSPHYSIEKAAALMRDLPNGDTKLVVTVVKRTLESMNIEVPSILSDAEQKEARLNNQHEQLKKEIQGLEREIADRSQRIEALLEDLKETTDVKEKLMLAQSLSVKKTVASTDLKTDDKQSKSKLATTSSGDVSHKRVPPSTQQQRSAPTSASTTSASTTSAATTKKTTTSEAIPPKSTDPLH